METRWRFYLSLLWPKGWVVRTVSGGVALYAFLDFWRNEGPEDAQPPKLIADIGGWLPLSAWIVVVFVVLMNVVLDNAYQAVAKSPSRRDPVDASKLAGQLSDLIENGDAYAQAVMRQQNTGVVGDYDLWATRAERLLEEQLGRSAVTDFRVARRPAERAAGPHRAEVWRQLDRVMAQLEVLQRLKREVESGTLKPHIGLETDPHSDDLIRVTPSQARGQRPVGGSAIVSETVAYLDVETADVGKPLRNCRIKLLDLYHYFAHTDRGKDQVVETWNRDTFYAGQTYFFSWSGRDSAVDAVDIHSKERATIARCLGTDSLELTTTAGSVGHLFHGDQYHLTVEVTADNARPVKRDFWMQMNQGQSVPIIKEWDDKQTTWL